MNATRMVNDSWVRTFQSSQTSLPRVAAMQDDTEKEQNQAAHEDVPGDLFPGIIPPAASGDGEGHRHTDDEHEVGLHQIPEPESVPRMMMKLHQQRMPERPRRHQLQRRGVQERSLGDEQEHRQPAEEVERMQPL